MAEQKSAAHFEGIDIKLITEGPESQDGHRIGSDVLHAQLKKAMTEVLEENE